MNSPLIKQIVQYDKKRFWCYHINGHFFGLLNNPAASIMHTTENKGVYEARIILNDGTPSIYHAKTFREAYNYIITKVIKPYFNHG